MVTRKPRGHAFCFSDEKNGLSHGDKRALRESGAVDKHIQKTKFALFVTFKDSPMASSNLNDKKPELADDKEKRKEMSELSLEQAKEFPKKKFYEDYIEVFEHEGTRKR